MAEPAVRILLREGTAAEWAAANPVLGRGEAGVEIDTQKIKIGDGATAWAALPNGLDINTAALVESPESELGRAISAAYASKSDLALAGGTGLVEDPDRPGIYLMTADAKFTEDPARPGIYTFGV